MEMSESIEWGFVKINTITGEIVPSDNKERL